MKPRFKLDKQLLPLLLLRMPKNVFLIKLSNLLVKFLYTIRKPVKGVKQRRIYIPARDGYKIKVDMCIPNQINSNNTLLYFPGGGFMMPATHIHKLSLSSIALELSQVMFIVHYRLAPNYPFPVAFNDIVDTYKYIQENALTFNINPHRIGIGGDSAGGNLAAGLSLFLKDQSLELPMYQLLLYPALDKSMDSFSRRKYTSTPMLNSKMLTFITRYYYKNGVFDLEKYTFPCVHEFVSNQEPTYIEILEYDPLHDDGLCYARLLEKSGNKVLLRDILHAVHGYDAMRKAKVVKDSLQARIDFIKANQKE